MDDSADRKTEIIDALIVRAFREGEREDESSYPGSTAQADLSADDIRAIESLPSDLADRIRTGKWTPSPEPRAAALQPLIHTAPPWQHWRKIAAAATALVATAAAVLFMIPWEAPQSEPFMRIRGIRSPFEKDSGVSSLTLHVGQKINLLAEKKYRDSQPRKVTGGKKLTVDRTEDESEFTVTGDGYLVFNDVVASACRVSGTFQLNRNVGQAMGYALALHARVTESGDNVECTAFNYDSYFNNVIAKAMPDDASLVRFLDQDDGPQLSDEARYKPHQLAVESNGQGLYTLFYDGQKVGNVHHFGRNSGRVAIRVWGGSSVTVKDLSLTVLDASVKPRESGAGLDLVLVTMGKVDNGSFRPLIQADGDGERVLKSFKRLYGKRLHSEAFLNEDAQQSKLHHVLSARLRHATSKDLLIVYLAGHGMHLGNGHFYLVTPRTSFASEADFQASSICINTLVHATRSNPHKLVLFVIDACATPDMSGGIEDKKLTQELVNWLSEDSPLGNVVVLAATQRVAYETDEGGVLTSSFVAALEGEADANHDKRVTLAEVVNYALRDVPKKTKGKQQPVVSQNCNDKQLARTVLSLLQ